MSTEVKPSKNSLSNRERYWLFALAFGLTALLATAATLTPEKRGFGTHRQLGLPSCTFEATFGLPCPSCGMTTAWAALLRGDWRKSVESNLSGAILCVLAVAACPWVFGAAVFGRWPIAEPTGKRIAGVVVALTIIASAQWAWRMYEIFTHIKT